MGWKSMSKRDLRRIAKKSFAGCIIDRASRDIERTRTALRVRVRLPGRR